LARDSSCGVNHCTPAPSTACFPSLEYRFWGHYTDQDGDPVELDKTMRAHAHLELNIARLKDTGLLAFPFSDLEANTNWMATVLMAADLVRWFQLLCLDANWSKARPKALRWGLSRPRSAGALGARSRRPYPRRLAQC
jgi:hypothetical protein